MALEKLGRSGGAEGDGLGGLTCHINPLGDQGSMFPESWGPTLPRVLNNYINHWVVRFLAFPNCVVGVLV